MTNALSMDAIRVIAEGFLACTFPATQFHHREHCLMTAYLLRQYPSWNLREDLPVFIRRFNEKAGGKNTDESGYHHTMTLFYLDAIERFMARAPDDLPLACARLLASPLAAKDFTLKFYSRTDCSRAPRASAGSSRIASSLLHSDTNWSISDE